MDKPIAHNDPITYSARGKVFGLYKPNQDNVCQGVLVTEDNHRFLAQLVSKAAEQVQDNPKILKVPQVWRCYPGLTPTRLTLYSLKRRSPGAPKGKGLDKFRIVGKVESLQPESVKVLIKRNKEPQTGEVVAWSLTLRGTLPQQAVGQFWIFNVRREGTSWSINSAHPVLGVEAATSGTSLELPASLNQVSLARRLGVSASTISKRKMSVDFGKWSQTIDPQGIEWNYNAESKEFTPKT